MRDWLTITLFPVAVGLAAWGIVAMLADVAARVAY